MALDIASPPAGTCVDLSGVLLKMAAAVMLANTAPGGLSVIFYGERGLEMGVIHVSTSSFTEAYKIDPIFESKFHIGGHRVKDKR